jgi:hypothetical protein
MADRLHDVDGAARSTGRWSSRFLDRIERGYLCRSWPHCLGSQTSIDIELRHYRKLRKFDGGPAWWHAPQMPRVYFDTTVYDDLAKGEVPGQDLEELRPMIARRKIRVWLTSRNCLGSGRRSRLKRFDVSK